MKRCYETAWAERTEGGWRLRLDKAVLRTPAQAPLVLPTQALAEAMAAEWLAQGDTVRPDTLPLTQLANTARDLVSAKRAEVIDQVAGYALTDLLCYRADRPLALVERQHQLWQPLLDWTALRFDAALRVASGLMPQPQAPDACRALRRAVEACDDWRLTALQSATAGSGSLVIGLALLEGRIDADQAFAAAELDETYQIEQWGADAEREKRRAALRDDLHATQRFARLLERDAGG